MNDENQQAYGGPAENAPPAPEYTVPTRSLHSPARAALCALVPGLGAVYNRQYQKAVIHFAVFAALTQLGDVTGVFVLASLAFYVFMMIDAYRSAEVIAQRGPEALLEESSSEEMQHLPLWGGFLVLIGVIFLLDSLDMIRLRQILEFWPLIFIGLGGYIIYESQQKSGSAPGSSSSSGGMFSEGESQTSQSEDVS